MSVRCKRAHSYCVGPHTWNLLRLSFNREKDGRMREEAIRVGLDKLPKRVMMKYLMYPTENNCRNSWIVINTRCFFEGLMSYMTVKEVTWERLRF